MSSPKAILKLIEVSIKTERYEDAVADCRDLIAAHPRNYLALVFLGFALSKLDKYQDAEETYRLAIQVKPNEPQAWQGLIKLYEAQGNDKIEDYQVAALNLAIIYQVADEKYRCQDVIDKFILFAKTNGSRTQYKKALELLLPTSPIFDFLQGRLPPPAQTYQQIAQNIEFDEKERINSLIGERRTRLGARIGQVTIEVKREVMSTSDLEFLYTQIINWSDEEGVRRQYEEKLIQRCLDMMTLLPSGLAKAEKKAKVWELATGIVIIKHPFKLAWDISLEWRDPKNIQDLDVNVLKEYCSFFPTAGLTSVLKGFLNSELSPFPPVPSVESKVQTIYISDSDEEEDEEGGVPLDEPLTAADQLLMISEGMVDAAKSILAHRLSGEFYQNLEEYESVVDLMRGAQRLILEEAERTGLKFENSSEHIAALLGTALVYYQSPKNHPEAKSIFENLLERDPSSTPALIGIGLIYEEEEDYDAAIEFFDRALKKEAGNIRVRAEYAWAKALNGDFAMGKQELYKCLTEMDGKNLQYRDLLAQTQYRYGMCLWNIDTTKANRKDRKGAYAYFLAALKTNLNFAPAYTILGIFYADYCKDKKRARKCFQKAFELSSSEISAAERLARIFAEQGEWELVEVIAQRVVSSGKIRLIPGSKKKGISWPHAALAVAELNKHDYGKSIASFQAALRISPDDYHSWVGLGESYHNCGRNMAATKALLHAQKLERETKQKFGETWLSKYMLANVNRELANYDEAIAGYQGVLCQRKGEYGVSIALIQALVESALDGVEKGLFGYAIERAVEAIEEALLLTINKVDTFNLWKAVGDACSIFSLVQSRLDYFPAANVREILRAGNNDEAYDIFSEIDGVGLEIVTAIGLYSKDESDGLNLTRCIHASILAHKRAIYTSANDKHAKSIAFYNLGWIEYKAHIHLRADAKNRSSRYLKVAIRCFKRSIEIEAGNSEFWNALGVVTSEINPKIAQHSFIRSLYLNERSAQTWSNLGTLYLLQSDYLLANEAFTRAQSSDPDFAHAWVGQGILAIILTGDMKEAHTLYTHALEISVSSSTLTKKQFIQSSFDQLISSKAGMDMTNYVRIFFNLKQLQSMNPRDLSSRHLTTLFLEQVNDIPSALKDLSNLSNIVEGDYELTESPISLSRFALIKSDIARCQLSLGFYDEAIENGEIALQLSAEDAGNKISEESRQKCRLSAYLAVGLAHYNLGQIDSALQYFLPALEESNNNSRAVCLLAQVLWAQGDKGSRESARSYLFDCIESHPDHVECILLLGIIALFDQDQESLEAVIANLHELRTTSNISQDGKSQVEDVLQGIAALSEGISNQEVITEIQTDTVLNPSRPYGWNRLSNITGDQFTAEMALKTALRTVFLKGEVDAADLSEMYAGTNKLGDAQNAIMNAPWKTNAWNSLKIQK